MVLEDPVGVVDVGLLVGRDAVVGADHVDAQDRPGDDRRDHEREQDAVDAPREQPREDGREMLAADQRAQSLPERWFHGWLRCAGRRCAATAAGGLADA